MRELALSAHRYADRVGRPGYRVSEAPETHPTLRGPLRVHSCPFAVPLLAHQCGDAFDAGEVDVDDGVDVAGVAAGHDDDDG